MTVLTVKAGNRSVLRSVSFGLVLVFIGCGGSSSSDGKDGDQGNGGSAGDAGQAPVGGGGSGGTPTQGGSGGTGATTGGAGNDTGGRAGQGGTGAAGEAGSGDAAGSGGDAGSAGMSGAAGSGADSCVNVSGGGNEPFYDLTVAGTQWDADDGKRMRIVVATQAGNRLGIGEAPIAGGAFFLSMPGVLNARLYVGVTLYVDRNDNDTCETDEHAWNWTTPSVTGDMRFDVTPDELCDAMSCLPWEPPEPACWVGTGNTVLTEPLPCNP